MWNEYPSCRTSDIFEEMTAMHMMGFRSMYRMLSENNTIINNSITYISYFQPVSFHIDIFVHNVVTPK